MPIVDGELILTWNGAGFTQVGWVGADGRNAAGPPSLPPGEGVFFFNPNATPTNMTFVSEAVPGPGSTNQLYCPRVTLCTEPRSCVVVLFAFCLLIPCMKNAWMI